MAQKGFKIDRILNVCGLHGPQPSIMIIETLKKLDEGEVIEIVGSKLEVEDMVSSLCVEQGYSLLDASHKIGLVHCIVRK